METEELAACSLQQDIEVCIMFIFWCFQNISRESMGNIGVNIFRFA